MSSGNKIEISLTDFIDFVCKSGSAKLTQVRKVKNREPYSPATDFYKALREGIVSIHEQGLPIKELKKIMENLTDPKKVRNYTVAIEGYKRFWGRKSITWFAPPNKHWVVGDLDIKVNPELGLEFDGKQIIAKLYLKSDKLSKDKIDQILTLMESQLRKSTNSKKETLMAVIDVKNGKIFLKENNDILLLPLLDGEARSFETIWKSI